MTTRTLYLLRHAEASPTTAGFRDRDRTISDLGRKQVMRVAQSLAALHSKVQLILTSSAMRTRQTAEGLKLGCQIEYSDVLYHAGALGVCEEISVVDDAVTSLLVVGHAPGIPGAVHLLADPTASDPEALAVVAHGYPTATLCMIELDGRWADVATHPERSGRLVRAATAYLG